MLSTDRPWENPAERILPVSVDWSNKYRQSFEFKTDIIEAEDGSEQRRSVRNEPRQVLEFDAIFSGDDMRNFQDFLVEYQPFKQVVPDPLDVGMASRVMLAGSSVMQVAERKAWMLEGTEVILRDGKRMETRTIGSSLGGNLVTFVEASPTGWPIGTRLHRTIRGRSRQQIGSTHYTSTSMGVPIRFDVEIGGAEYVPAAVDPGNIVGFREVWFKRPNWSDGVEVEYHYLREDVDYGFGRVNYNIPNRMPKRVLKADYIGVSPDDIHNVVSFFIRHKGRRNEFLFITGENDIPYNAILGGSSFISVVGQKFGRQYLNSNVFRRVVLRKIDRTYVHGLIDEILINELFDTTTINLTENLPNEVFNEETLFGVSWGLVTRMGSDKLDIDWLTDEKAQFSMTFESLENTE